MVLLHSFLNQTKDSEINELESDSDYQELDINELESDSDSHDQELEQEASSTAESIRPSLAGTKKQTESLSGNIADPKARLSSNVFQRLDPPKEDPSLLKSNPKP
ncbi:hypothetical protein MJO29_012873 [Puccinia striiformis f. sp. tritici]|nr:hypothetical protein MJO29_012873 [Puccinia striiformis f. sp. tritici]